MYDTGVCFHVAHHASKNRTARAGEIGYEEEKLRKMSCQLAFSSYSRLPCPFYTRPLSLFCRSDKNGQRGREEREEEGKKKHKKRRNLN